MIPVYITLVATYSRQYYIQVVHRARKCAVNLLISPIYITNYLYNTYYILLFNELHEPIHNYYSNSHQKNMIERDRTEHLCYFR
jgi:hypothetical protein